MKARLWRRDLALTSPIVAAQQVHATRAHLFLELEIDGVIGFGEISPQPVTLNGDAGLEDVVTEIEHFALRQFVEAFQREGRAPPWARITHFAGSRPASNPASTLLEMAVLDAELRARHLTVGDHWPPVFDTPIQVTMSLLEGQAPTPARGTGQIRAKVSTLDVTREQWQHLASCGLPVLLDFNCAGESVDHVLALVADAQRHIEVVAVEQPFAPGNVVEHARLAQVLRVPVSLDEGVRNRRDLDQIARYNAARMVCVKPMRVGGYAQARTMIERAHMLGLEAYLGGFFESPVARRVNRALANHLLSRPSDIGEVALEGANLFDEDPWGCGLVPGEALTTSPAIVNRRW